jgi:hypothetical protein
MRRDDVELPQTRQRIGRAVDDELQAHLDERIAELVRAGMGAEAAAEQAHREFGDVNEARAELREIDEEAARVASLVELARDVGTDVRRAVRGLARRPLFALTVIGTLSLGIGANAVMFGLVDRLLLSPPAHVSDADRVVRLRYNLLDNTAGESHGFARRTRRICGWPRGAISSTALRRTRTARSHWRLERKRVS